MERAGEGRGGMGREREEGGRRELWKAKGDWGALVVLTVDVWQEVRLCPLVVDSRRTDHNALNCFTAVCAGGGGNGQIR